MLRLGNIKHIEDIRADEIWLIVRNLKGGMPKADVPVYHVPELSPSKELYSWYIDMVKKGEWNQKAFDMEYAPRFVMEMQEEPAWSKIMELAEKSLKKDICVCCFCDDTRKCHKTLVQKFVKGINTFYCVVAGSRDFDDYGMMKTHLDNILSGYAPDVVIISGGAKGADLLAERYADENGYKKHIFLQNGTNTANMQVLKETDRCTSSYQDISTEAAYVSGTEDQRAQPIISACAENLIPS